jgi:hypothetical protein
LVEAAARPAISARGGFLKRRTPLNARGTSDISVIKEEIQALLRNNLRKAQYDAIVKTIIQLGHVALWEALERDSWRPQRTTLYD